MARRMNGFASNTITITLTEDLLTAGTNLDCNQR